MATTTLIKTGISKPYMMQTTSLDHHLNVDSTLVTQLTNKTSQLSQQQQQHQQRYRLDYTQADVYDDAAIIGSELEKIITNYGADVIKDLMPKVIQVLELLEDLTLRNEKENDEIGELRTRIAGLEAEKTQRINEREKFEKELEEIEEKWKLESLKLIDMVNKLKDENKRLNELLAQNNSNQMQNEQLIIKQEELDYIRQIKEENIKLKEAIRLRDKELEQKTAESDALHGQVDSLTKTMVNYRRKQIVAQNQIEKMVKAKAELECSVTEKDHQLNLIRETLHKRNIQNQERIQCLDDESQQQRRLSLLNSSSSSPNNQSTDSTGDPPGRLDSTEYLIIDVKDPNRPRFTLNELQKVLMEKNQLTVKLDQTKDELEQLRRQEVMSYGEVQGPINKEPEEKLDPSSKPTSSTSSGIRRLYVLNTTTNNLLNVELVVIYNCCLNILPLNDLCLKQNAAIHTTLTASSRCSTSLRNELDNLAKSSMDSASGNDHSSASCLLTKHQTANSKCLTPSSTSTIHSFKFSLLILMLNIYYLLMCVYMNKFLVNLFSLALRLLVNSDLVVVLVLLNLFKTTSKRHKSLVYSCKKLLLLSPFNLINVNHFLTNNFCVFLFTICCFFFIVLLFVNSSLSRLLRSS